MKSEFFNDITNDLHIELSTSYEKHGSFNGAHEGYAVILEELDELWDHVKMKRRDFVEMKAECIQIAAMALKFAHDVCEQKNRR